MKELEPKLKIAILRVLRDAETAIGSQAIAREIQSFGFDSSPRTIRLYLQDMAHMGLVDEEARRGRGGGRSITRKGIDEIKDALAIDRVGFTAAKVDNLSWQMTFNPSSAQGLIVLNVSTIEANSLERALEEMLPVFEAGLAMGDYMAVAREGEMLGRFRVPEGKVGIGTVCSVTVNGALLSMRIPTVSRFGGVLEIQDHRPIRFTDVIYYDGTTLDPLEVFIKSGLTSVREAVAKGHGRIGASFREVPTAAMDDAAKIFRRLNPVAAVEELGIRTQSQALSTLYDFHRLIHYREVLERVRSGDLHHTRMTS
jgi:repressor of nif and glnA expression